MLIKMYQDTYLFMLMAADGYVTVVYLRAMQILIYNTRTR